MSSVRTIVRDRIIAEFTTLKDNQSGRVPAFDISARWLSPDETKRQATYCVIVTDESRSPQTLQDDMYDMTVVLVLYANDTTDARAKLDSMIDDAIDVLRRAFRALGEVVQRAHIDVITTTEASNAEDDWPQAVIRWTVVHQRQGMV